MRERHVPVSQTWKFTEKTDAESIFEKMEDIGAGGFGTVCKLIHVDSGACFAGKVISPDTMSHTRHGSFAKEVSLMRHVKSKYTVRCYGSVNYEGSIMLIMEFCDRGSIRDIMNYFRVKLNEDQIKLVIKDVLLALTDLHGHYKMIHRDIKAANILVQRDGSIRLTDFGVASQFDNSSCVAPYWMAPEVINGHEYSYPADIWSVGATVVELLEGIAPYGEYSIRRAIVSIERSGFSGFRDSSKPSDELKDFVYKCMEINPSKRATIEELMQHPFLDGTENLDRMAVMGPLLEGEIDFKKLLIEEEEEESVYEEEEEIYEEYSLLRSESSVLMPEQEPGIDRAYVIAGAIISLFVLYKTMDLAHLVSLVVLICVFLRYKG